MRGDITRSDTICRIRQLLNCSTSDGGRSEPYADVIVCDGAADVTGVHDLDSHLGLDLVLAALGSLTLPPTLPIFPSPPSYGLACVQSLHFLGRCVRFSCRIKVPGVPCAATLPLIKSHACLPTALTCVLTPYWRNFVVGCCVCVECVVLCGPGTCRQLLRSHGTFVAKCFLPDDAASTRGSGLTPVTHSICDDAVRAHEVWVRVEEAWESSSLYIHAKALFERVVTPAKSLFFHKKKCGVSEFSASPAGDADAADL